MKICFSILYIHRKVDFPGFDAGWLHCGVLVKRFITMFAALNTGREVMGSIPVGNLEFFFVPRSCHVD